MVDRRRTEKRIEVMTREKAINYLKSSGMSEDQIDSIISAFTCDDCISRAKAIEALYYDLSIESDVGFWKYRTVIKDLLKAIYNTQKKAIEDLPPVTLKPKTDVLDKIRAEILEEKECAYADFEQYKVVYLGVDAEYVEDELPQDDFRYGMERALEIIDKHIADKRGAE